MLPGLGRRLLAEGLGTAVLVAAVVGSGIAAQRLSPDDVGLQLLENTLATVFALVALILALGPVSGAHINPAVTLLACLRREMTGREGVAYIVVQLAGGLAGTAIAHTMFELAPFAASTKVRAGASQWVGEVVATAGLLLAIRGALRTHVIAVPFAVAAWIGAAYWFTSSTSFANPAVTLARGFSDTFSGIAPASVPAFVGAQVAGVVVAAGLGHLLYGAEAKPPATEPA
ncbi:MAG: aquaporin [Planctomycetota bacterium]